MTTPFIQSLRAMRASLLEVDADLRRLAPKCPGCDRPIDGYVPAGRTAHEVGIADPRRCPRETCPMKKESAP